MLLLLPPLVVGLGVGIAMLLLPSLVVGLGHQVAAGVDGRVVVPDGGFAMLLLSPLVVGLGGGGFAALLLSALADALLARMAHTSSRSRAVATGHAARLFGTSWASVKDMAGMRLSLVFLCMLVIVAFSVGWLAVRKLGGLDTELVEKGTEVAVVLCVGERIKEKKQERRRRGEEVWRRAEWRRR